MIPPKAGEEFAQPWKRIFDEACVLSSSVFARVELDSQRFILLFSLLFVQIHHSCICKKVCKFQKELPPRECTKLNSPRNLQSGEWYPFLLPFANFVNLRAFRVSERTWESVCDLPGVIKRRKKTNSDQLAIIAILEFNSVLNKMLKCPILKGHRKSPRETLSLEDSAVFP